MLTYFLSVLHGKYELLSILFLLRSSIKTLLVPVRLVKPFSRYITDLCNEYNINNVDLRPRLTSKKRSLGQRNRNQSKSHILVFIFWLSDTVSVFYSVVQNFLYLSHDYSQAHWLIFTWFSIKLTYFIIWKLTLVSRWRNLFQNGGCNINVSMHTDTVNYIKILWN